MEHIDNHLNAFRYAVTALSLTRHPIHNSVIQRIGGVVRRGRGSRMYRSCGIYGIVEHILSNIGRTILRFQNGVGLRISTRIDNAVREISRLRGVNGTGNGVITRIDNGFIIQRGVNDVVDRSVCCRSTEIIGVREFHNLHFFRTEGFCNRMRHFRGIVIHSVNHHFVGRNRRVQHILNLNLDVFVIERTT